MTVRATPKDGGWGLEFAVPAIDAYKLDTLWEQSLPPIPTPLGTLSLSAGAELRYITKPKVVWEDVLGGAFMKALAGVGGFPNTPPPPPPPARPPPPRGPVVRRGGAPGAGPSAGGGFRLAFVIDGGY